MDRGEKQIDGFTLQQQVSSYHESFNAKLLDKSPKMNTLGYKEVRAQIKEKEKRNPPLPGHGSTSPKKDGKVFFREDEIGEYLKGDFSRRQDTLGGLFGGLG